MNPPSIFEYRDPVQFLKDYLSYKKALSPGFSIRNWARLSGFRHHAMLGAILRGNRGLTPTYGNRLAKTLALSDQENAFFDALIHFKKARTPIEKKTANDLLLTLIKTQRFSRPQTDSSLVNRLYQIIILEISNLKNHRMTPSWIAKQLGIPIETTRLAINTLRRLGMLVNKNGKLIRTNRHFKFGEQGWNVAIKSIHAESLERARKALFCQSLSTTDFRSTTFVVSSASLPKLKSIIKEFHAKILELEKPNEGETLYHFCSQLFCLVDTGKKP